MTRTLLMLIVASLSGCVLQGGAHTGYTWNTKDGIRDQWTWGGRVESRADIPISSVQLTLGAELEGRIDEYRGSLMTWGPQLGVEFELSQRISLAPHLDFGWPAGWLNPVEGYYVGLTLGLPVMTDDAGSPSQVNRNYRFIDQAGAVVPYVRLRMLSFDIQDEDQGTGFGVVLGLAVRTKLVTDLL